MMPWLRRLSRERELRMIWGVEREGTRSYLVGTAHFFPYRFGASLRGRISEAEAVLFEGPLDEASARRIVEYGSEGGSGRSLVEALDPATIRRIARELHGESRSLSSHQMFRRLTGSEPEALDWDRLKGMRPWMAFFQIWSRYLQRNGWTYNMELDALRIAGELGRPVHFLETIEEQLQALDDVPLERFVHFLTHVNWKRSRRDHQECYLRRDLEGLLSRVSGYPTACEAIIERRDPILYERMRPFLERGPTIAFVGASHCRGITRLLRRDGYRLISPPSSEKKGTLRL